MQGRRSSSLLDVNLKIVQAIAAIRSRGIECPPELIKASAMLAEHNRQVAAARAARIAAVGKMYGPVTMARKGITGLVVAVTIATALLAPSTAWAAPAKPAKPVWYKSKPHISAPKVRAVIMRADRDREGER